MRTINQEHRLATKIRKSLSFICLSAALLIYLLTLVLTSCSSSKIRTDTNSEAFQVATKRATDAESLTKSAETLKDWSLVISQWQQAVELMKSVPTSSSNYVTAQNKVLGYQKKLTEAKSIKDLKTTMEKFDANLKAADERAKAESTKNKYCITQQQLKEYRYKMSEQCEKRLESLDRSATEYNAQRRASSPDDSWLDKP